MSIISSIMLKRIMSLLENVNIFSDWSWTGWQLVWLVPTVASFFLFLSLSLRSLQLSTAPLMSWWTMIIIFAKQKIIIIIIINEATTLSYQFFSFFFNPSSSLVLFIMFYYYFTRFICLSFIHWLIHSFIQRDVLLLTDVLVPFGYQTWIGSF